VKQADVYEAVMAADDLPSPSAVAMDLFELVRQPDAAVEDVARLIGMDPGICARVMRSVNSAATGARSAITSVEQAVTMLGMRSVARMAVEVSVLERNRSGLAEFDYGSFWAESLARAAAARIIATWSKQVTPEEAFTYGLLARIGRLALVSVYPSQYRELLLTLGESDPAELAEAECALFEVNAETLSARMLKAWGMGSLHDAMSAGDAGEPSAPSRDQALLQTCRAAGHVAKVLCGTRVTRDQIAAAVQAMAGIGIGAEVVTHLFPDIIATLRDAGAQLQIPTGSVSSLADVYAQAIDAP
jgi:hypothetical protein